MTETAPTQRETKKETFATPCSDFNMSQAVLDLLMKSLMEDLDELRFYFTSENQIDAFVAEAPELKDNELRIQVARMRRAWSAVRRHSLRRESEATVSAHVE